MYLAICYVARHMEISKYLAISLLSRYMEISMLPAICLLERYMEISMFSATVSLQGTWKFPCIFPYVSLKVPIPPRCSKIDKDYPNLPNVFKIGKIN